MRSSLTRSHLKELEGKKVIYKSYYMGKKKHDEGVYRMLFQNVKIGLWDPNKSISNTRFTHTCDHCWLVMPRYNSFGIEDFLPDIGKYRKGYGIGTVGYYTRNDQSVDLSIIPHSFVALDQLPLLEPDLSNLGRVLRVYRDIRKHALSGKIILLSPRHNFQETINLIDERIRYYESVVHSQTLYTLNTPKTHTVTSPRSFKDLVNGKHRSPVRLTPAEQSRILRSVLSGGSD